MFGILAFGDSITHGRGEKPNIGWVGRLKQDFEALDKYNCVFNLGIPGDTSTELLRRIEIEATPRIRYLYEGDRFAMIIAIGTNDARSVHSPDNKETSPEQFSNNLASLVRTAKQFTQEIILLGLTPVDEKITNPYETTFFTNEQQAIYNKIIEDISAKEDVHFINMLEEMKKKDYFSLLTDGLHPNTEGYDYMYEIVKRHLQEQKILPN